MIDYPGFDPKTFTDEQIIQKMQELSRRLIYANRFSGSFELVAQLQNMMAALEFERRERVMRHIFDLRNAMFPEIIETDPEMKEQNGKEERQEAASRIAEDRPRKSKRAFRQPETAERVAPRKTSKPTLGDDPPKTGDP